MTGNGPNRVQILAIARCGEMFTVHRYRWGDDALRARCNWLAKRGLMRRRIIDNGKTLGFVCTPEGQQYIADRPQALMS